MFRKLRLQLTLVNMCIMALLFLLLTAGSYLFVQERLTTGAFYFLTRLSSDLINGKFSDLPPFPSHEPSPGPGGPGPGPGFGPTPGHFAFFVRVNSYGQIVAHSSNQPFSSEPLTALTKQALALNGEQSTIQFEQIDYVFLKAPIPGQTELYLLFQDFSREKNAMHIVITALILIGLICIFLSYFGSLYMANKAMVPIQQAWQQQKDFLADASHELRTPLAVIQTNLEIVRSSPQDTIREHERWLDNIYTETLCMTKLVDSLLFLARADSHQQFLQKDCFDLGQAVQLAGELFRPLAERKNIKLLIQTENLVYLGDESKLCQVVSILTDNAIRHTFAGGSVTISLSRNKNSGILTVHDTGEGIGTEHLDKIFNRFYQADPSRTDDGSGLGLSIAKLIVESHGGTVSVSSSPGAGATFTVHLPIPESAIETFR
ncbi:sensor histidine kinase [Sporomusa malonica]|uniref:histidine kinase n=1 Tax=Sporomusa malonica TaxID=112901 RepID=A0A1W2C200_9FIRM|nr:ATP-binding protein [Sporomusa malonica]SMC79121.1 His Kinase A (phospho-acceptor) domain-containing protein [Sporomusa malonica]